jgi:hypothetical protein
MAVYYTCAICGVRKEGKPLTPEGLPKVCILCRRKEFQLACSVCGQPRQGTLRQVNGMCRACAGRQAGRAHKPNWTFAPQTRQQKQALKPKSSWWTEPDFYAHAHARALVLAGVVDRDPAEDDS